MTPSLYPILKKNHLNKINVEKSQRTKQNQITIVHRQLFIISLLVSDRAQSHDPGIMRFIDAQSLKNLPSKIFDFRKNLIIHKNIFLNPQTLFGFCFAFYKKRCSQTEPKVKVVIEDLKGLCLK